MHFYIHQNILDLGLKAIGVLIQGIDNHTISDDYLAWRNQKVTELVERYIGYDLKSDEILEGFYALHAEVNVPRRKIIPASENLIRLLQKKQDMFSINKAVDIYNILSMESKLALGAHDIDHVFGDIHLQLTTGKESYVPLGCSDSKPVKSGEYAYIDEADDILCWLEVRQVEKDKVTEDTKNVFYIVQGNEKTPEELLRKTAEEIISFTTAFCGGSGNIIGETVNP